LRRNHGGLGCDDGVESGGYGSVCGSAVRFRKKHLPQRSQKFAFGFLHGTRRRKDRAPPRDHHKHLAPVGGRDSFLAVALGHLGEVEEAGQVWRELMEINPKYSFAEHVGRLPFRNKADVDQLAEGLSKAGIAA
jgi:hypothetical protein